MIDDAIAYVDTKNNKEFFNFPPGKKKSNNFLQKKEEETVTEQLLRKVFPELDISKSKMSGAHHNKGGSHTKNKR